jgi:hypothetical protein
MCFFNRARPVLALGRPDAELFLRARHRAVGLGPGDVVADDPAARIGVALGQTRVRARLAVAEAVVAVELLLLVLGELPVGVHLRRVLDLRRVVGHLEGAAGAGGLADGHERLLRAE